MTVYGQVRRLSAVAGRSLGFPAGYDTIRRNEVTLNQPLRSKEICES